MTRRACERAPELLGRRSSGLSPEIREHVAGCEDCRRALRLAGALNAASPPSAPTTSPSAGLLWWKSRLADRARIEDEALRPVVVAETIVPPALLTALGVWLIAGSATWAGWLRPLTGDASGTVAVTAGVLAIVAAGTTLVIRIASGLHGE